MANIQIRVPLYDGSDTASIIGTRSFDSANVLVNPSFEWGVFSGWIVNNAALDKDVVYNGDFASRVEATGAAATVFGARTGIVGGLGITINASLAYRVTAYHYVSSYTGGNYRCRLQYEPGGTTALLTTITAVTSQWIPTSATFGPSGSGAGFTTPSGTTAIRIYHAWESSGSGVGYMDDCAIAPLSGSLVTSLSGELALKNLAPDEFGLRTSQNIKATGDGALSYNWNALNTVNADSMDVSILSVGRLTINHGSTATNLFNATFTGPYIWKDMTGDWEVETAVGTIASAAGYEGYALLTRSESSTAGEDWVAAVMLNAASTFYNRATNTTSSVTAATDTSSQAHYLKLSRTGSSFAVYSKVTSAAAWTLKNTYSRDFGPTIQVGLMYFTDRGGNGIFEYFRVNSGGIYSAASPTTNGAWLSLPLSATIQWGSFHCPSLMNSGDAGSVRFAYRINSSDVSSYYEQLALKVLPNEIVTNNSYSLMGTVQFVSDGTQRASSRAYALLTVNIPDAVQSTKGFPRGRVVSGN